MSKAMLLFLIFASYQTFSDQSVVMAQTIQPKLASRTKGNATQLAFEQIAESWDRILKRSVMLQGSRSQVNYLALHEDPSDLNHLIEQIEGVTLDQFNSSSDSTKLSFLINAYNALTVKLIVDHYPVNSIKDIGGMFSSPWKKEFFALFGQKHHLDYIEHELIRKRFSEPRIHFALVCASKGCPALRNEAFTPPRLNQQLEESANRFLKDPSRNFFDRQKRALHLSSIFKWYGDDFKKKADSVPAFVAPRMARDASEQKEIEGNTSISYLDYDWSLNGT